MGKPRKFDWDEAARLYRTGLSMQQIGAALGVSDTAVWLALNPEARARAQARNAQWQRNAHCPDCGAQTTRNRVGGDSRCVRCSALARAASVREDALRCPTCRKWKPDEAFPRDRSQDGKSRRGRHRQCCECANAARQDYRERNRESQRAYDREYKRRRRQAA